MFEAVFVEALAQADGENWNHENAWRSVEVALAQRAGEPMNRIAAELDAVLVLGVRGEDESGSGDALLPAFAPSPERDRLKDFGERGSSSHLSPSRTLSRTTEAPPAGPRPTTQETTP